MAEGMSHNIATIHPLTRPKPRISVVMVSYMTGPALFQAITSVLRDPDIYELIVVDNGNTGAARASMSEHVENFDNVRLMQGHGNIGFARGCNYGAALATGEFLLFLNPDAVISSGAALSMARAGMNLTRPWIVGGLLRNVDGTEQRGSRRREVTPARAFAAFTGLRHTPFFKGVHLEHHPLPTVPEPVDVVSGACMMMDRASFEAVDGFDEKYFLHVEDIDICRRVKKCGGTVLFHPKATVLHYGSTSQVPRYSVEWEKLKGFVRYFSKYTDSSISRYLTLLASPFMAAAIMGRAAVLSLRAIMRGY